MLQRYASKAAQHFRGLPQEAHESPGNSSVVGFEFPLDPLVWLRQFRETAKHMAPCLGMRDGTTMATKKKRGKHAWGIVGDHGNL